MSRLNYPQTVSHADYEERRQEAVYRGKHRIMIPGADVPITIDQANLSSVGYAVAGTGEEEVQIIFAQTEKEEGIYHAMSPADARRFASQIVKLADEIEAMGGAA